MANITCVATPEELGDVYNESVKVACVGQAFCHAGLVSASHTVILSGAKNLKPAPSLALPPGEGKGFTLSEVLITLGIIGVVAALIFLSLINNHHNKQLETGLKRSYSLLSQALDSYYYENGERITGYNVGSLKLKPILMKYLKKVKDCGAVGCVPNIGAYSNIYKNYTGTSRYNATYLDDGQFILNDSSLIMLENYIPQRLFITVDVNGYRKGPNKAGHDLFMFQIMNNGKLVPMGAIGTYFYSSNDRYCRKTTNTDLDNGSGCTYKALTEKDYFKNLPK